MVVVSSVNGHGVNDGMRLAPFLRESGALRSASLVIGGRLSIHETCGPDQRARLRAAGFDFVFEHDELPAFRAVLTQLGTKAS